MPHDPVYLGHACRPVRTKPVWIIYKITDENGRAYVGCTVRPVDQRWDGHCSDYRQRELSDAIRTRGKDRFTFSVLDEALSGEEARRKEIKWILVAGTLQPNGYNKRLQGVRFSPIVVSTKPRPRRHSF